MAKNPQTSKGKSRFRGFLFCTQVLEFLAERVGKSSGPYKSMAYGLSGVTPGTLECSRLHTRYESLQASRKRLKRWPQNGMVERVIRTLKEQCALRHASRVIGDWIRFYNHRRPHQTLGMRTPR